MKVPIWEAAPGALAALLNGAGASTEDMFEPSDMFAASDFFLNASFGRFVKCDLHTFTLAGDAGVIRIAAADLDVTYPGGPLWPCSGPRIDPKSSRQTGHWKRGLDVDQWVTTVMPRVFDPITGATFPDTINGSPWVAAARQGALDGAEYQVDRAYFASWPQPYVTPVIPVGIITMFAGFASEVDVADSMVVITSDDFRALLSAQMPAQVYQGGCRHTLFDSGCKLDSDDFKKSGTLLGTSTRSVLTTGDLPAPSGSGTYVLGRIVMTSGLNATFSRSVASFQAGRLSLLNPLPFAVGAGDTFDAYPGCDKTQATCALFANSLNYGGQPYIPSPEAAL